MRLHAAAALPLAITRADAAGITEVTTRTFEAETSKGDPLLLVFYAPWCGHCRRLEPTLHQLAASAGDAYSIAKVDGTTLVPLSQIEQRFTELDPNQTIYLHCKAGVRSLKALGFLREQGFKYLKSVKGGITAWSEEIDPKVPKY